MVRFTIYIEKEKLIKDMMELMTVLLRLLIGKLRGVKI